MLSSKRIGNSRMLRLALRLAGVVMAMLLCFTVLGGVNKVFADGEMLWLPLKADDPDSYINVYEDGAPQSGDGWSYDKDAKKLTLNNFSYSGLGIGQDGIGEYNERIAGIYSLNLDYTIVLTGTNSITMSEEGEWGFGIYCNGGNLTILGDGTLNVTSFPAYGDPSYGISAYNITIGGDCTISAQGGYGAQTYGISASYGDLTIGDNAVVEAKGGDGGDSVGLYSYGNIIISGKASVTATAGQVDPEFDPEWYDWIGMQVYNGDIQIGESITSVVASGETTAIEGTVKNAVAGRGWYDVAGTDGNVEIPVNEEGLGISDYKKVQFPDEVTPSTQFTITYDLNGGKLDGQTGTVTKKVDAGTVITLPAPTKDGYTFDYWEGSKYNAGDKYTVNEDHTFKAVWKTNEAAAETDVPKTGDHSNTFVWIALMAVVLVGGSAVLIFRKLKKEQ